MQQRIFKSEPFVVERLLLKRFDSPCCFRLAKEAKKAVNPMVQFKQTAASTFAAVAIGSSILGNPLVANAVDMQPVFSSTNVVAEKVVRQGLYSDYEVEINQETDDARSTFKSAGEYGEVNRCDRFRWRQ